MGQASKIGGIALVLWAVFGGGVLVGEKPLPVLSMNGIDHEGLRFGQCPPDQSNPFRNLRLTRFQFRIEAVLYLYYKMENRFVLAEWDEAGNQPSYLWWGTEDDERKLFVEGSAPYSRARNGETACPLLMGRAV